MEFKHVSVLLQETIDGLNVKPDGIYVDGTTGGGGHSYEICKRLGENGRLICIDQDTEALAVTGVTLLLKHTQYNLAVEHQEVPYDLVEGESVGTYTISS